MSIEFHKVTWYSRILALILFLGVLPLVAFYLGTQYESTRSMLDGTLAQQTILFLNEAPMVTPPAETVPVSSTATSTTLASSVKATFSCDNYKSIVATFYPANDTKVDLVLSDGRTLTVPHAVSADGARYATADESFVFWNVGKTATITEKGKTTYANCTTS